MEKTTLYLPSDLQRSLRDLSRRTGRPQAELIREALGEYVAEQASPWPKSIGSASDGAVSGRDSEGWLREQWSKDQTRSIRRSPRA